MQSVKVKYRVTNAAQIQLRSKNCYLYATVIKIRSE